MGAQWQRTARIADEPAGVDHRFGGLSLARDGRTLAAEASDGARVYTRDAGAWTLAAVLVPEASNGLFARFGTPRLSGNGAVLAVQGLREIPNPQFPTAPAQPDAFVALFTREATSGWIARTTVRSTKPQDCCAQRQDNDEFATSLALNHDGSTLAVGAPGDNSDPSDTVGDLNHGRPIPAPWIFRRTGEAVWSRQAFVKALGGPSFGPAPDFFGTSVALDRDGRVLAATALGQSLPVGVNCNQAADRLASSGLWTKTSLNSEVRPTCLRPTRPASGRSERRRFRRSSRAPAWRGSTSSGWRSPPIRPRWCSACKSTQMMDRR